MISHTNPNEEVVVDFTNDFSSAKNKHNQTKAKQTTQEGIDLASGFPISKIWTTRDGRKIPIPMMEDSHLSNTIAYLRTRAQHNRNKIAIGFLMKFTAAQMMFDNISEAAQDALDAEQSEMLETIQELNVDELAAKVFPTFSHLLQEAYKRKLLIEN